MHKKHYIVYLLLSLCFILVSITTPLFAIPSLNLHDNKNSYTDFTVEYFENTMENELTINEVQKQKFKSISNAFTLGYNTNTFWFRVRVINRSDKEKRFFLELTEIIHKNVDLYIVKAQTAHLHEKNGLSVPVAQREVDVPNPTFSLNFKPNEEIILYIKLNSIYGVFGQIQFKIPQKFYEDTAYKEKLYIFYYGAILMIALYNLFIFLYLREKIYLYYVSYVFIFVIWSSNYKGILLPYISMETYDLLQITIPVFFSLLALFSQSVLETKKYFLTFHKILNFFIIILVLSLIWMLIDMHSGFYFMNIAASPFLPFLLFIAIWALFKGHKIAQIYLVALFIYLVSMIILSQLALGLIPYSILASNAPIIGSFFEIMLLSLLLAYRINILRQEKLTTQEKLLHQEETESLRLANMVEVKTSELDTLNSKLNVELKEKKVLYQELNHRVKNNLLMILSLIQLQISRTPNSETKRELLVTKNRIHSIAKLYENFHLHESDEEIDTIIHFKNIIENIRIYNYDHIKLDYNISYNLNKNDLLYAGLILNELATNAFKYAFTSEGTITISLFESDHKIMMSVEDDGNGFETKKSDSLGLIIVKTLVEDQLYGEVEIESSHKGTKITIIWEENG